MANRKSLKAPRSKAFRRQNGLCFYCQHPMWQGDREQFAQRYGLTTAQTRLMQCTGEHLMDHAKGGKVSQENIVAACRFCNQHRHQRPTPLTPGQYRVLVEKRVRQGKWHQLRFVAKMDHDMAGSDSGSEFGAPNPLVFFQLAPTDW